MKVNRRKLLSLLGISPALLADPQVTSAQMKKDPSSDGAAEPKLSALSPKGTPPPVNRFPMAPSLTTIDQKTIYLVDTGFFGGDALLEQMSAWFAQNKPSVKIVLRKKVGTYPEDDPKLWAEIKANGSAAIMAIGH